MAKAMDLMASVNENIWTYFIIILIFILFVFTLILILKFTLKLSKEEQTEIAKSFFSGMHVKSTAAKIIKSAISMLLILPDFKKSGRTDEKDGNKIVNDYLWDEYASSKRIRVIFINLFVVFTMSVIAGFIWLDKLEVGVRVTIGCIYFGFSLFVLFIIKSCYSRSAVIISIMEDQSKKDNVFDFIVKYKKEEPLNEFDIAMIKMITTSRAEREKSAKHPYEIILKNIQGSSLSFDKSKIEIGKEKKETKS